MHRAITDYQLPGVFHLTEKGYINNRHHQGLFLAMLIVLRFKLVKRPKTSNFSVCILFLAQDR